MTFSVEIWSLLVVLALAMTGLTVGTLVSLFLYEYVKGKLW